MTTAPSEESVYSMIEKELLDLGVPAEDISPDLAFDAMDVDSLDIADLMGSVKDQFGVDIPRAELSGVTIGGLVARIVGESKSA